MALPLHGLRVLDLTNVMAGPFCCYQLALLGAEVIKVEAPGGGDLARQLGADVELSRQFMGTSYLAQNAGKKSIAIDLKHPDGKAVFRRLAASADAVIESFRPGVMTRLGLDAASLRADNERLVYCALSGFGQTGPLSERPAYDQIIQGLSGIMSVTGSEATAPLRVGFPISDAIAGLNAAMAVAAALAGAARTGKGCTIDVSMLEATMATAAWVVSNYLMTGQTPQPMGNENRTACPSGTFRTKDDPLNIAANKQAHWEAVARVLGVPELIHDPRFEDREDRKRNRAELNALLEARLVTESALHWEEALNAAGVPAGRVLSVPDALALPQVAERGLLRTFDDVAGVGRPITVLNGGFLVVDEGRGELDPPARLGEHGPEILAGLGFGADEIERLRAERAIRP